jgi:hypothetical protein
MWYKMALILKFEQDGYMLPVMYTMVLIAKFEQEGYMLQQLMYKMSLNRATMVTQQAGTQQSSIPKKNMVHDAYMLKPVQYMMALNIDANNTSWNTHRFRHDFSLLVARNMRYSLDTLALQDTHHYYTKGMWEFVAEVVTVGRLRHRQS